MTIAQSDGRFKELGASKLLQFCGCSTQSIFTSIHGFTRVLLQGRAPDLSTVSDTQFTVKVKQGLGRFCKHEVTASATGAGSTLYGQPAADKKFTAIKSTFDGGVNEVTLGDLKPLVMFAWLLPDEQNVELKKITHAVIASQGRPLPVVHEKSVSKNVGAKKNAETAKMMAASMFM